MTSPMYAAIELGGTKTICLVGPSVKSIREKAIFSTTNAAQTLPAIADFLMQYQPFESVGIGTFGPVELNSDLEHFGTIQLTPKIGWSGTNLHEYFTQKLKCPVFVDTDVNAAALAEYRLGAAKGLNNIVYVTVGTGIGAGALINGKPVKGVAHPEMGHINLPRAENDKEFESSCPFHKNCAEGLASGTAITKRWGKPLNMFPLDHPAWDMQAHYLAEFAHTLIMVYAPDKIIFGGGVSSEPLLEKVRKRLFARLNDYVSALNSEASLKDYITLPMLGGDAGPFGSFLLNDSNDNDHF